MTNSFHIHSPFAGVWNGLRTTNWLHNLDLVVAMGWGWLWATVLRVNRTLCDNTMAVNFYVKILVKIAVIDYHKQPTTMTILTMWMENRCTSYCGSNVGPGLVWPVHRSETICTAQNIRMHIRAALVMLLGECLCVREQTIDLNRQMVLWIEQVSDVWIFVWETFRQRRISGRFVNQSIFESKCWKCQE